MIEEMKVESEGGGRRKKGGASWSELKMGVKVEAEA